MLLIIAQVAAGGLEGALPPGGLGRQQPDRQVVGARAQVLVEPGRGELKVTLVQGRIGVGQEAVQSEAAGYPGSDKDRSRYQEDRDEDDPFLADASRNARPPALGVAALNAWSIGGLRRGGFRAWVCDTGRTARAPALPFRGWAWQCRVKPVTSTK